MMKAENRNKMMVLAIVALVILNLSTIVTVVYRSNKTGKRAQERPVTEQLQATTARYSGRYFRDALNLTTDQLSRFKEFNPGFRQEVMNINSELDRLRSEMMNEMASGECDCGRLDAISDTIGDLHARLKKATHRYYIDLKNICDQQQQEKLEQLFNGMFAGEFRQGRYGKGNQHGRQRGRQSNN